MQGMLYRQTQELLIIPINIFIGLSSLYNTGIKANIALEALDICWDLLIDFFVINAVGKILKPSLVIKDKAELDFSEASYFQFKIHSFGMHQLKLEFFQPVKLLFDLTIIVHIDPYLSKLD